MSGYLERVVNHRKRGRLPYRELTSNFKVVPENEYVPPTSPVLLGDTWDEYQARQLKRRKSMSRTQPLIQQANISKNKEHTTKSPSPKHILSSPLRPSKSVVSSSTQREDTIESSIQHQTTEYNQNKQDESGIQLQIVNKTQITSLVDKNNQIEELLQVEEKEEIIIQDKDKVEDDEGDTTIVFDMDMELEEEEKRSIIYIDSDTDEEGLTNEARMAIDALYIKEEDTGVQSLEEKENTTAKETNVILAENQSSSPNVDIDVDDGLTEPEQEEIQPKENVSPPAAAAAAEEEEEEEEEILGPEEEEALLAALEEEEKKEGEAASAVVEEEEEEEEEEEGEEVKAKEEEEPALGAVEEEKEGEEAISAVAVQDDDANKLKGDEQKEKEPQNDNEKADAENDTILSPGLAFDNDDNFSIGFDAPEEYNQNEPDKTEALTSANDHQARPTVQSKIRATDETSMIYSEIEGEEREIEYSLYRKNAELMAESIVKAIEEKNSYDKLKNIRASRIALSNLECAMAVIFETARRFRDATYDESKKKLIEIFYENYRQYMHNQELLLLDNRQREFYIKRIDQASRAKRQENVAAGFKVFQRKKENELKAKELEKTKEELKRLMELESLFVKIKNRTNHSN